MRKLLYFALVLLLAPLILAFIREGVQFLVAVFSFDSAKWFLLGAALSFLVCVLLNNSFGFLRILLHELEHAAVYFLLTGRWPRRLEINPTGGSVTVEVGRGGCLLLLAPYYFPLLTVPFLLIKALAALAFSLSKVPFPPFLAATLDLLIGATLVLHVLCTFREFGSFQTDITESGMIVSLVIVFFLNFMFIVLSITVVTGSYAEFLAYVKTALVAAWDIYQAAFAWLKEHVPLALKALWQRIKDL